MSRKAESAETIAASLAMVANGGMVAKGYGSVVTAADVYPVAAALVRLDRQGRRIGKRLARNARLMESMTGPAVTAIPAADVAAAAEAAQLARLRQMTANGTNLHKPTTTGRPDVDPRHDG